MKRRAVKRAEQQARHKQSEDEGEENRRAAARGGPKIVRAPAERLWRIAVNRKAGGEPNKEKPPQIGPRELQPPDIHADEGGESDGFEKRENALYPRGKGRRGGQLPGLTDTLQAPPRETGQASDVCFMRTRKNCRSARKRSCAGRGDSGRLGARLRLQFGADEGFDIAPDLGVALDFHVAAGEDAVPPGIAMTGDG